MSTPKPKVTRAPSSPVPTASTALKPPDGFVGPITTPVVVPTPAIVPGGEIIANNGAALTGKVKAPAGIIANNGGGLISDKGGSFVSNNGAGYRLQALAEAAAAGVPVKLVYADGSPVLDAKGAAITTVTGADGGYTLPYAGGDANVVALATLPDGRGEVVAFVPRGARAGATALDLDTTSTFTLGYVLARYVRRDRAILEKLPADMEAATRTEVARSLAAAAPPDALTPGQVVARVEQLRKADAALDGQLETVRRTLLAGLSEQGVGRAVTDVEIAPNRALRAPTGEIVWADTTASRVFKRDLAGKIAVVAGTGRLAKSAGQVPEDGPAPGDGGPATLAAVTPAGLCYGLDGSLIIAETLGARLRKVAPDGTISTLAVLPPGSTFTDLEVAPDGSFRLSTPGGIFKVAPDGKVTHLAGEEIVTLALLQYVSTKAASGDGGPPLAARFRGITGIGVDPRNGDTIVYDAGGVVRRVGPDKVERLFGLGAGSAVSGNGGPAATAGLGASGDVAIDAQGRYWLADGIANQIRVVGADGIIDAVAGTGAQGVAGDGGDAKAAQLGQPFGLWLGAGGECLVVADGLIRRVADGKLTTEVGALALDPAPRPASKVQFLSPDTLELEPSTGAILICDNRHVWRWRPQADTMEIVVSRGLSGVPFVEGGDAFETYTNLFFAALPGPDGLLTIVGSNPGASARVGVIEVRGGKMTTVCGLNNDQALATLPAANQADLNIYTRLARWQDDYVIACPLPTPAVYRFKPGGRIALVGGGGTQKGDGVPFSDFKLSAAAALRVGPDGALYVGDFGGLIRVDPATGAATYAFGAPAGPAPAAGSLATAVRPKSVAGFAWDGQGRLHVSDFESAKVWRVEADGKLTLVAGAGGPNLAGESLDDGLALPTGLVFDGAGDLYVADRGLHQIKRIPASRLP